MKLYKLFFSNFAYLVIAMNQLPKMENFFFGGDN